MCLAIRSSVLLTLPCDIAPRTLLHFRSPLQGRRVQSLPIMKAESDSEDDGPLVRLVLMGAELVHCVCFRAPETVRDRSFVQVCLHHNQVKAGQFDPCRVQHSGLQAPRSHRRIVMPPCFHVAQKPSGKGGCTTVLISLNSPKKLMEICGYYKVYKAHISNH